MCLHEYLVASVVSTLRTPRTVIPQDPLSMGFSKQEYWSGLPCAPLGDPTNPGIEPGSLAASALQADFFFTTEPPRKPIKEAGCV